MGLTIDISPIQAFFQLPGDEALYVVLVNFGWIPIFFTFLWGAIELWKFYREGMYDATIKYVLLAIDIPRGNEQSVTAVENMVSYFGGAHGTLSLIDRFWRGKFQLGISLEIVSIEGYTQFLIRTPVELRNLVESAVYSQYPDAELTEVNDYTVGIPTRYPDKEYDIWGAEFILAKPAAFPIKTYKQFGDDFSGRPGTEFKDPMASLMDLCSSLQKGEQLWYQILILPTGFEWTAELDKEVSKILKEKVGGKSNLLEKILDLPFILFDFVLSFFDASYELAGTAESTEPEPLKMLQLKPREKKQVEAIHEKISKQGFLCKQRMVYVAKKEVMNRPKVVSGFVGYMKQFMDLGLNNIKPDMDITATKAEYFFKESRITEKKLKLMNGYKARSFSRGRKLYILNTEELATLWHFPLELVVKAPLIQKAPGRKSEPPMTLPFEETMPTPIPAFERELSRAFLSAEPPLPGGSRDEGRPVGSDIENKEEPDENGTENIFAGEVDESSLTIPAAPQAAVEPESKGLPPPNLPFA